MHCNRIECHWIGNSSMPGLQSAPPLDHLNYYCSVSEHLQSIFRATSEQLQSNFRATPEQLQSSTEAVSEQLQSNSRAIPEHFKSILRAILEQLQRNFRATLEQFKSSFRAQIGTVSVITIYFRAISEQPQRNAVEVDRGPDGTL